MALVCPECGDSFQDGRGLFGHLRWKEGLEGKELDETFEEAKKHRGGYGEMAEVVEILDRYRRARNREKALDSLSTFGVDPVTDSGPLSDLKTVCVEERKRAEEDLKNCLQKKREEK